MISIALATYNGEKYLREQMDSILNQTVKDFELVVCDDCSSDSTLQILNDYTENDARIKVFRNEQNLGFKKNFEKAISLCTGDYIALSDQDDVWTENHLQVLLENIGGNDLIGANAFLCNEKAEPIGIDLLSCSKIDFLPESKDDWFFFLLHSNIFQGAACLIKKSLVQKALSIPENVKFHDYWFAIVAAANNGVAYINECILYYRQHGTNVTENKKWNFFEKINYAFQKKENHFVSEQIDILEAFLQRFPNSEFIPQVKQSLSFYKALGKLQRIKFCAWYLKNFKSMFCSKSIKLRFLCFVKNIILGI